MKAPLDSNRIENEKIFYLFFFFFKHKDDDDEEKIKKKKPSSTRDYVITLRQLVFPIYSPLQQRRGHRPFDHSDSSDEIRLKSFSHRDKIYRRRLETVALYVCIRYTSITHSLKWNNVQKILFCSHHHAEDLYRIPYGKYFRTFFFFCNTLMLNRPPLRSNGPPPPGRNSPWGGV
jgi:hypothetical protein